MFDEVVVFTESEAMAPDPPKTLRTTGNSLGMRGTVARGATGGGQHSSHSAMVSREEENTTQQAMMMEAIKALDTKIGSVEKSMQESCDSKLQAAQEKHETENKALKAEIDKLRATQEQQTTELAAAVVKIQQLETAKEQHDNTVFTKEQLAKLIAVTDTAIEVAKETAEKEQKAVQAALEREIKAKADRIKNLEAKVEKLEEQLQQQEEGEEAAPAATTQHDLTRELAQLQETVKQQGATLDKISTQHTNYDDTVVTVKEVDSNQSINQNARPAMPMAKQT